MNDQGQIKEFKSDEEAKAAGFGTKLSAEEAEQIESVPEDERKIELAFIRFWNHQKSLRPFRDKATMRFAFKVGFKVAIEMINEE
jgi:hypothetical protein